MYTSESRSEISGKFWNVMLEKDGEKISWTDRVRNEEMLHGVKEERNIVHRVKRRKANWIFHNVEISVNNSHKHN